MNWRKIITVFVIGIIATSSAVGIVSAAPADYKYYYKIDGETYYQETEWGIYPPFVANPTIAGVYENVTVYDSEGNVVGVGTITRYQSKIMAYSANVEWNSNTEDKPTEENAWNYTDIEIQSQANNYADNGTKYRDTITSEQNSNNITTTVNNNTVGDNTNNKATTNNAVNNNTTGPEDENNDEQGIPMAHTGGVISIVSIAMIILIIIVIAKIVRRDG